MFEFSLWLAAMCQGVGACCSDNWSAAAVWFTAACFWAGLGMISQQTTKSK